MLTEFSIDKASDQIYNSQTREYFKEVLQAYVNGNYRSAIVMLWTVVICDLVYKLTDLRDAYSDPKAKAILEEIEQAQTDKPHSSEWENTLLKNAFERLKMFSLPEKLNLEQIQQIRNLCAHPIIDQNTLNLYMPSKDQARSLIRNALELLLLRPPMYTKEIIKRFWVDIEERYQRGVFTANSKDDLKRYIKSAYLSGMNDNIYKKLFESAWKLSFKTQNEDTKKNKPITLLTLKVLYDISPNLCCQCITERPDFFKEIDISWSLSDLVNFLSIRDRIYKLLPEPLQINIEKASETDFNLFMKAHFLSDSLENHFHKIKELYDKEVTITNAKSNNNFSSACMILLEVSSEKDFRHQCLSLFCDLHSASQSYDDADVTFSSCIVNNIESFNSEQILKIIRASVTNGQIYYRRRFSGAIKRVLTQANSMDLLQEVKDIIEEELGTNEYSKDRYERWQTRLANFEPQEIHDEEEIPF